MRGHGLGQCVCGVVDGGRHSQCVSVCQDCVADKKRRCSPDSNSEVKCAFFEADQGDRVGVYTFLWRSHCQPEYRELTGSALFFEEEKKQSSRNHTKKMRNCSQHRKETTSVTQTAQSHKKQGKPGLP